MPLFRGRVGLKCHRGRRYLNFPRGRHCSRLSLQMNAVGATWRCRTCCSLCSCCCRCCSCCYCGDGGVSGGGGGNGGDGGGSYSLSALDCCSRCRYWKKINHSLCRSQQSQSCVPILVTARFKKQLPQKTVQAEPQLRGNASFAEAIRFHQAVSIVAQGKRVCCSPADESCTSRRYYHML